MWPCFSIDVTFVFGYVKYKAYLDKLKRFTYKYLKIIIIISEHWEYAINYLFDNHLRI